MVLIIRDPINLLKWKIHQFLLTYNVNKVIFQTNPLILHWSFQLQFPTFRKDNGKDQSRRKLKKKRKDKKMWSLYIFCTFKEPLSYPFSVQENCIVVKYLSRRSSHLVCMSLIASFTVHDSLIYCVWAATQPRSSTSMKSTCSELES